MNGQKFCLKWDHFRSSVTSVFNNLRQDEELVDITLCCEGHKLKAHRMMLSACSPYFRELLKENPCQHPVFFLKDTSAEDLRAVIEFVYNGEVNVAQTQLASFIKTAEMLQIRGLSGEDEDSLPAVPSSAPPPERRPAPPPPPPPAPPEVARSPAAKRRRRSASPEVVSRPAAPPPPPPPPLSRPPQQQQQSMAHSQQSHSQHSQQSQQSQQSQSQQLSQQVEMAAVDQGRLPPQSPADIKVEKVDLTDADDDPSLEAALGRVVSYEGAEADLSSLTADDSLGEAGPSGGLSGDRSMQATWREIAPPTRSDAMLARAAGANLANTDLGYPLAFPDPLATPRQFFPIDPSFIQLNMDWLDAYTRDKLLQQRPFMKSDWHKLVNAIFDNVESYPDRVAGRKWYTAMASLLMDRFPHLFVGMSTIESLDFVKKKLRTKFKNGRFRESHGKW